MPGYVGADPIHATVLNGVATLQCKGGIIGTNPGAIGDTLLLGCYIPLAATPSTLTITGLADNTAAARSWLITGLAASDVSFVLPAGILNDFAAFTFTPSASNLIIVYTRAFTGGQ